MKNKRILYIDILNIIACISVVFLHCNGIVHIFSNTLAWKQSLVIQVVCYFAVPVFLMITGANLLNYREKYNTKDFFKKRLLKVVIPYVVWSIIYFIDYRNSYDMIYFAKEFLNCRIEGVFLFFPLIIYLYLIMPLLSLLSKKENEKTLYYILFILILFKSIIPFILALINKPYPSIISNFNGLNGYIIFILLGYVLSKKDIKFKNRIIIYILSILCLLLRYFYTYHFSITEDFINKDLFNYCYINSVIVAIGVFILIKSIKWDNFIKNSKVINIISKISSCSLGVYLIHMLMIGKFIKIFNLSTSSLFYRIPFAIILYLICLIIVLIIKKIPILKKIVP